MILLCIASDFEKQMVLRAGRSQQVKIMSFYSLGVFFADSMAG